MKISDLRPSEGEKREVKRVGRGIGSGTGKTSTRGHKGQWARSGGGVRPNFEGGQMPMTRRLPKIGFNNARFAKKYNILNLEDFNRLPEGTDEIDVRELKKLGFVSQIAPCGLKVLANGKLERKIKIIAQSASKKAIEKAKKSGGKICLQP